jgi:hypothetical protein
MESQSNKLIGAVGSSKSTSKNAVLKLNDKNSLAFGGRAAAGRNSASSQPAYSQGLPACRSYDKFQSARGNALPADLEIGAPY